jgi:transposase, IS5 family
LLLANASVLVHFRKRISSEILSEINDLIVATQSEDTDDDDGDPPDTKQPNDEGYGEAGNDGTLLMDATCVPAAIHYPTDLPLLNDAREMTETIIDTCHAPDVGTKEKPRTYRQKARKQYLAVAKKKKPRVKAIRRALRQQLQHIRRNLETIRDRYGSDLTGLSQPHVRPIVRGKTAAPVEFGVKISAAKVGDFAYLDRLSWDAYNESGDLTRHVEAYRRRFGRYPKTVQADAIYRTRENQNYCKERGTRLGGPPLGRPKKNPTRTERYQARDDERSRIPIEGVFGRSKTRYSLSRIMAKRRDTSESTIALAFPVMNLDTLLRQLSLTLFRMLISLFGHQFQGPIFPKIEG